MRVLLLLLLTPPLAHSCGVLIHNTVVRDASQLFSLPTTVPEFTNSTPHFAPLLRDPKNAPAIQAGGFFPDWGYQCLARDDSAEAAHWPPFLLAAVDHLREEYPADRKRDAAEQAHVDALTAFLFAVVSHQVADATWHSIRMADGLLAAFSAREFDGDTAAAHRHLDVGGDFLAAARMGRLGEQGTGWIANSWWVPVRDILEIYGRVGRKESEYVVRYCMSRGLAALRSEMLLAPGLVGGFMQKAMLQGEMEGYHLGGTQEMTARTVGCWEWFARWLELGVPQEERAKRGWGMCDVFRVIARKGGDRILQTEPIANRSGNHILHIPEAAESIIKEQQRVQVSTDRFGAETYKLPALSLPAPAPASPEITNTKLTNPRLILGSHPNSLFGSALTLTEDTLLISAPLHSTSSSHPHAGILHRISLPALSPLPPLLPPTPHPHARFSTAVTPLNHTFLISSPGAATLHLSTHPLPLPSSPLGSHGPRWPGTTLLSLPPHLLAAAPLSDTPCPQSGELHLLHPPSPPLRPHTCLPYARFSTALAATNNTLFVGAPGAATVHTYTLPSLHPAETISAPCSNCDFAAALAADDPWLAVAAPAEPVAGAHNVGVLRVYERTSRGWVLRRALVPRGREANTRFGSGVVRASGGVWVASQWAGGERGAVWWVAWGGHAGHAGQQGQVPLGGAVEMEDVAAAAVGAAEGARFGAAVAAAEDGRVFVGMPGARDGAGRTVGAVLAYAAR